jgi:predicted nucleic acid-binding protein
LIAVDTSVVVAAFASWHEAHDSAARTLDRDPCLPSHALIESYSVLTRLPAPHRAPAALVAEFLADRFSSRILTLSAEEHVRLIDRLARVGLAGGAVYDAVIALTAKRAGAVLVTRDRRALPVYEHIGAACEVL